MCYPQLIQEIATGKTSGNVNLQAAGPRFGKLQGPLLLLVALSLFSYYGIALNWSFDEFGHCLIGMFLLWAPVGALLYVLLYRAVGEPIARLALSFAGSYTLTTLLYFAATVIRLEWLFGAGLFGAAGIAVWFGRRLVRTNSLNLPPADAVLLTILAASLVTTIPYTPSIVLQPSGNRLITGFPEQPYHVGLEYELDRHVPPSQATIRGGTPERAYHMFPHLTAMLISRFTGQREMLRAHGAYHYATITILICLELYGIGFLLTSTKTGGYVFAFLPFLFAIALRPVMPNQLGYFFFSILPQATSSVFPTLFGAPQMYSGIAVMYGVLLGVAAIVRTPWTEQRGYVLPLLCSLMTASMIRFRVHCWLATLPAFLILALFMWRRTSRIVWLLSAVTAIAVSALLYAEMAFPIYLRGTTEIHFGFNGLSQIPFYKVWPFSSVIERLLRTHMCGVMLDWTWQMICLAGFTVWDIVGIPLCITVLLIPAIMNRSQCLSYYIFTVSVVLLSIALAASLTMGYDGYSVPGQFLYHLGWYLLPLGGVGVAWLASYAQRKMRYASILLLAVAGISGVVSAMTQHQIFRNQIAFNVLITPAAWDAFHYVKEWTPGRAVVLSTSPRDREVFAVSGLGGRAAYLEAPGNVVDQQALRLNPGDNRALILSAMETAQNAGDPVRFCALVAGTPITHILEEASNPLMSGLPCLRRLWMGRDGATAVWQVVRQ